MHVNVDLIGLMEVAALVFYAGATWQTLRELQRARKEHAQELKELRSDVIRLQAKEGA